MNKLAAIIYITFALLVVACASSPKKITFIHPAIRACIDDAFNDEEISDVESGIKQWTIALQEITNIYPSLVSIDGDISQCRILIMRVTTQTPWVAQDEDTLLGVTDQIGGHYIWIVVDRHPEVRPTVVAHEIGHSLGLPHTDDGLMAPTMHDNKQVSESDAMLAAYYLGKESIETKQVCE